MAKSLKSYDRSRLTNFRSYRYYFALVMCDTSDTASQLAATTDLDVWQHPTVGSDEYSELGIYSARTINISGESSTTGKYCVIINGSTDAAFVINKVEWTAHVAAQVVAGDYGTSIATEGEMTIVEPRGVLFFDQLILCARSLGIDIAHASFLLKPFFVGYVDNPNAETHITDIRPISIQFLDSTSSFTTAGGIYIMPFVGFGNGLSRLPQYARVADGLTIKPKETLKESMQHLIARVQSAYNGYKDCVMRYVTLQLKDDPNLYIPVEYQIILDPVYESSDYKVDDGPSLYKTDPAKPEAATIKVQLGGNIETTIREIMMNCSKVREDSAKGDGVIKFEFKIRSTVEVQTDKIIVTYIVTRIPSVRGGLLEVVMGEKTHDAITQSTIDANTIEFDYTHTGQNVDVLDLDMKMNIGQAYLQISSMSNTFKDQLEYVASRSTYVNPAIQTNRMGTPAKIPLFFGTQIRGAGVNDSQTPSTLVNSMYTLAKHASLEMLASTLTIFGNESLLDNTSALTQPKYYGNATSIDEATTPETPPVATAYGDFPLLAKINIKMPAFQDDLQAIRKNAPYARSFWFDGYYNIVSVKHIFDEGTFTQQLLMFSIPPTDLSDSINAKQSDGRSTAPSVLCADSPECEPCKKSTVPKKQPTDAAKTDKDQPTTKSDADVLLEGDNPEDVVGWSKASPQVKNAIIAGASKRGCNTKLLAMFASKESTFDTNAKAPSGSAGGLFQFINSTWTSVARSAGLVIYGDPKYKFDPEIASEVAAYYLGQVIPKSIKSNKPGDLYLAWFIGENGAKKIIASNETATLIEVLGEKTASKVYKNNPWMVPQGITTAGTIRAWAAKSMAKSIKGGTSLAKTKMPEQQSSQVAQSNASPTTAGSALASAESCDKNIKQKQQKTASEKPTEDTKV